MSVPLTVCVCVCVCARHFPGVVWLMCAVGCEVETKWKEIVEPTATTSPRSGYTHTHTHTYTLGPHIRILHMHINIFHISAQLVTDTLMHNNTHTTHSHTRTQKKAMNKT